MIQCFVIADDFAGANDTCLQFRKAERPVLAITMGDVNGIGPEIIAKVLCQGEVYDVCRPVVIGNKRTLEKSLGFFRGCLEVRCISDPEEAKFKPGIGEVIDLGNVDVDKLTIGQISEDAGRAAVGFVEKAVGLALEGRIDGVVTAPLNKEAMNRAGFRYAGHTELLAELTETKDYRMMLVAGPLKIVHVTTHASLRKVPDLIKEERIFKTIELAREALTSMDLSEPRIGVAGLNPHAGEGGLFGDEETAEIIPAVERAKALGWDVTGPVPPDTIFYRAVKGEFDCVVAMYHDQGHIPAKLLAFERGVNVTLGLPIMRTSVDHGTAFNIAGKGMADPSSLMEAIKLGARLVANRGVKIGKS